jgi:hypothetical protein
VQRHTPRPAGRGVTDPAGGRWPITVAGWREGGGRRRAGGGLGVARLLARADPRLHHEPGPDERHAGGPATPAFQCSRRNLKLGPTSRHIFHQRAIACV